VFVPLAPPAAYVGATMMSALFWFAAFTAACCPILSHPRLGEDLG
jgi:hypothetical protein